MMLIVNNSSMIPIYQQIVEQIKLLIRDGKAAENEPLPSVRSLSKDLKISALTVKKAYDQLEEEGFVKTVHGKGTFISVANKSLLMEEKLKEIEADFELAIQKGLLFGIKREELREMFDILLGGDNVKS